MLKISDSRSAKIAWNFKLRGLRVVGGTEEEMAGANLMDSERAKMGPFHVVMLMMTSYRSAHFILCASFSTMSSFLERNKMIEASGTVEGQWEYE
jgi:hypothetical protein